VVERNLGQPEGFDRLTLDTRYSIIKALGHKASETIGGGYGALEDFVFASFRFLWGDPVLSWSMLLGTALRDGVH